MVGIAAGKRRCEIEALRIRPVERSMGRMTLWSSNMRSSQIRASVGRRAARSSRTQIIRFGVASCDSLGKQVTEHIGGYLRVRASIFSYEG